MECIYMLVVTLMTAGMMFTGFPVVAAEDSKAVFLLAGQSNMVGLGGTETNVWDHYIPPLCQADPRILRLNNEALWEEAHEPLHINISSKEKCFHNVGDLGVGPGPGMPFANTLLQSDPAIGTIGLVPCAVVGTQLSWWARGGCLYNTLLERAQAALKDEGATLRGMLWYQGESDTREEALADAYEEKLKTFFNDFRGDIKSPELPIIQVALASAPANGAFIDKIRSAQLNFNMSNVRCVDAKGLALNHDNLHLTTESQVKLGSMLAEAFLVDTRPLVDTTPAHRSFATAASVSSLILVSTTISLAYITILCNF